MSEVEQEIAGLVYIAQLKAEIKHMEGRYHARIREKDFELADIIKQILDLYKQDLKECENGLITGIGGSEILAAQPGRGKTVFVLKR